MLVLSPSACLTLGHGSILSIPAKQNMNTKSSTGVKLVGVDDVMTFVVWMKHFFESQVQWVNMDCPLKPLGSDVTIEQDNKGAIQLEKNAWKSSSKRIKYINVLYFYITNWLKVRHALGLRTNMILKTEMYYKWGINISS